MQQSNFENLKNNAKLNFFEIVEYNEDGRRVYERELKRKINRKELIKTVRKIAFGFDKLDLRKPINDYQYKKARKILADYIEATDSRYIPIRPSKKYRNEYAKLSDLPNYYKIYPVPVSGDITRFEFKGDRIIERGAFIDYTTYLFDDQEAFARAQKKEIKKLIKKVSKKEKYDFQQRGLKQLRIKTGRYHTRASYATDSVIDEIMEWNNMYGRERVNAFVRGFVVAEFHDQRKIKKKVKKTRLRKRKK